MQRRCEVCVCERVCGGGGAKYFQHGNSKRACVVMV